MSQAECEGLLSMALDSGIVIDPQTSPPAPAMSHSLIIFSALLAAPGELRGSPAKVVLDRPEASQQLLLHVATVVHTPPGTAGDLGTYPLGQI